MDVVSQEVPAKLGLQMLLFSQNLFVPTQSDPVLKIHVTDK
jgi:hypothetical protein